MYRYYLRPDELQHHGVLGMKWGVRRYQNKDGSYTSLGQKHRSADEKIADAKSKYKAEKKAANAGYKKATKEWQQANKGRSSKDFMNDYSDADKKFDELGDKYLNDAANAKKKYKNSVRKIRNDAVSEYSKAYDKWSSGQDKNDEYRKEVDSLYEKCGKNKLERIVNVAKGKSPEAKKYLAASEDYIKKQDVLDEDWHKVEALYKETGSNFVDRVVNNARYDIEKSKKK